MITYYKPNKNVKGSACSFKYNEYFDSLFIEMFKQTGWDDKRKKGSFKGSGDKIVSKFNVNEIAAFVDSIENNREFKIFHSSEKGSTSGSFSKYEMNGKQVGFSLSLTQKSSETNESTSIRIGFNFPESVLLREFLKTCLQLSNKKAIDKHQKFLNNNRNSNNGNNQSSGESWDDWSDFHSPKNEQKSTGNKATEYLPSEGEDIDDDDMF